MIFNRWFGKKCVAPAELQEGDLIAYIEGDATPTVIRHITHCPICSAEVLALRKTEMLLTLALQEQVDDQTIIAGGQGRLATQLDVNSTLNQPRNFSLGGLFTAPYRLQQVGIALATLLFMIGTVSAFYSLSRFDLVLDKAAVLFSKPKAEVILPEVDIVVMAEAAVPDIDLQTINQNSAAGLSSKEIIRNGSRNRVRETTNSTFDRYTIIHPDIVDISIAGRIITEEIVEIAPPLDLRLMFEKEFQNKPNDLLVHTGLINSEVLYTELLQAKLFQAESFSGQIE